MKVVPEGYSAHVTQGSLLGLHVLQEKGGLLNEALI